MTHIQIKQRDRIDLPAADELAAMVREAGIDTVADDYGCSSATITRRLQRAGYNGVTGETKTSKPDSDLPAFEWQVQPWADDALCGQTDPEMFFPEKGGTTKFAKSVCARCTVAAECLDWALDHNERFGIWGGLSERERRHLTNTQESA
jgi:WhiB family redox-sensing transcriptional regulator